MASAGQGAELQAAGSGDEEAPVPDASPGTTSANSTGITRVATSAWRWPSQPGKLPEYVQARFRVKAFGLLALQSGTVLGIMILVDLYAQCGKGRSMPVMIFVGGVVMVIPMIMLASVDWKYPANYALLVTVTLLSGTWWGLAGREFGERADSWDARYMHFQLFGCICGTACAATALAALLPCAGLRCGRCAAAAPLILGWVVGAAAELPLSAYFDVALQSGLVAAFVALVLFLIMLLDVGGLLVDCDPDLFMRIVISMNSTILVMLSLPIFIISACILWSARTGGPPPRPEA